LRQEFITKAQRRRKHTCKNITIRHTEGPLGARFLLEELPFAQAHTIMVLADSEEESNVVDIQTLAVSVQIQDILLHQKKENTVSPMIMPQLIKLILRTLQ